MNFPDTQQEAFQPNQIQEDKRNGYGTWMFLPGNASPLLDTLPKLSEYGDFTEIPTIVSELGRTKSVLVEGAPGSGKSHLIRDIQTAAVINDLPTFCLTMHINGGHRQGVQNIEPLLEKFHEETGKSGGLVILDNIDYMGYRGSGKRGKTRATEFAQNIQPVIQGLLDNPKLAVLGTAHDAEWRRGQWTWDDPRIDEPAGKVLDGFASHFAFEGNVSLVGLAHLLRERNNHRLQEGEPLITIGQAARVIRELHRADKAKFFYANHLPVPLFLENPQVAINQIEAGRNARRGVLN